MKIKIQKITGALILLAFAILNDQLSTAFAQGTAFTYQGQLQDHGSPARGTYNFMFTPWSTSDGGSTEAATVTTNGVIVTNGLFTVTLDFGSGVFNGQTAWLEIAVETNMADSFTTLIPRQQLTPTPYAIYAENVSAAGISGTIQPASLGGTYGNAVTLNNAGNSFGGSFSGNGANVANVNAAALNGLNSTNFWQLGGNNVPAGQFLGSTNKQSLELRAGNQRGLLITTNYLDSPNLVGGSPANMIDGSVRGAVIAGGGTTNYLLNASSNHISADFSSIGGGSGNTIQSSADHSLIGGGLNNIIGTASEFSVIGGGLFNTNVPLYGAIVGGGHNAIQSFSSESFIGGGFGNSILANAPNSVLVGGIYNSIQQYVLDSFVGGGDNNVIQYDDSYSFIGGGEQNNIYNDTVYAFIGGGQGNSIQTGAFWSYIGGGQQNDIGANAEYSTVAGGYLNTASGENATVAGGDNNTASQGADTVAGGEQNIANGGEATVLGGDNNQAMNYAATVAGGENNVASGQYSFAAGQQAQATNDGAFVWADSQDAPFASTNNDSFNVRAQGGVFFVTGGAGVMVDGVPLLTSSSGSGIVIQQNSDGAPNVILGSPVNFVSSGVVGATISGGGTTNYFGHVYINSVTADFGTVGGGADNTASGVHYATVGGGYGNTASGDSPFVGGGGYNTASGNGATVGGGFDNTASGGAATVGGGYYNTASGGNQSTVAGGYDNTASGDGAFVGGGGDNTASGVYYATVGGGYYNTASGGNESTVAGGNFNTANADNQPTVGGGTDNQATNDFATVPGGYYNIAGGKFSFAAGQQAQALHQGAFVWADSQNSTFSSTANDQFLIRAQGGVGIDTGTTVEGSLTLNTNIYLDDHPIYLRGNSGVDHDHGLAYNGQSTINFGTGQYQVDGPALWGYNGGLLGTRNGGDHAAVQWDTTSVTVNGTFNNNSDRNAKQNFTAVTPAQILDKVTQLPLSEWSYKVDAATRHIGPMAQDFYSAFNVGTDDKHIAPIDEGGVALAAIQALNQKLNEKDAEIQQLQQSVSQLKEMVNELAAQKKGGTQ